MKRKICFSLIGYKVFPNAILDYVSSSNVVEESFVIYVEKEMYKSINDKAKISVPNIEFVEIKKGQTDDDLVKDFFTKVSEESVVIVRSETRIKSKSVIEKVVKQQESGINVVTVKTKNNKKISKFFNFKAFFSKLLSIIFGFCLYQGSYSLIAFDASCVSVFKNISSKTLKLSKIDNWAFVKKECIESEDVVFNVSNKSSKKVWHFIILLLVLSLIITTYILLLTFVPNVRVFYFHIVMIMASLISLTFCFHKLISMILHHYVGNLE